MTTDEKTFRVTRCAVPAFILADRHEQQQPILRPAERRNQLGTILDSQSAGGSGTDIDQPAAISQSRFSGERRRHKSEADGSYRGHCCELALDHCLGDVRRFPDVDIRVAWARALGTHGPGGDVEGNSYIL